MWTIIESEDAFNVAVRLAKGTYQLALLQGEENLSGSTLKGKARKYSSRYKQSREALLARMTKAGVPWYERKGKNNRRILVLG